MFSHLKLYGFFKMNIDVALRLTMKFNCFQQIQKEKYKSIFRKKLKFKFLTQTQLENDKILSSNVQSYFFFLVDLHIV